MAADAVAVADAGRPVEARVTEAVTADVTVDGREMLLPGVAADGLVKF